jgi:hypothetical protein
VKQLENLNLSLSCRLTITLVTKSQGKAQVEKLQTCFKRHLKIVDVFKKLISRAALQTLSSDTDTYSLCCEHFFLGHNKIGRLSDQIVMTLPHDTKHQFSLNFQTLSLHLVLTPINYNLLH